MEANGDAQSKSGPGMGCKASEVRGWNIVSTFLVFMSVKGEALLGSQAGCGNASRLEPIVKSAGSVFNPLEALLFDYRTKTNQSVHL
jgi:hypothetical protein